MRYRERWNQEYHKENVKIQNTADCQEEEIVKLNGKAKTIEKEKKLFK